MRRVYIEIVRPIYPYLGDYPGRILYLFYKERKNKSDIIWNATLLDWLLAKAG